MSQRQKVCVLGSTGSIGMSTLKVIAEHPQAYELYALTAHSRGELLLAQCLAFQPRYAVLVDETEAASLRQSLQQAGCHTRLLVGAEALQEVASDPQVDTVMAAIVGGAGLLPTLAAVRAGKKVLLANKEALVMAGELFMDSVQSSGATLLPIDSEHNAIFQCLPVEASGRYREHADHGLEKIMLTASGGPFLHSTLEEMRSMGPTQACAHPNWAMGPKISVDSATMLNKSLELIEASYLFNVPVQRIDVLIHPQSIVHSMVYYRDGSVLAQLGNPDMRTPIAHALAWPRRIHAGVNPLDLVSLGRLDFHAPDVERFPCLSLGRQAAEARGNAPLVLNAANEVAVAAFLGQRLGFMEIPAIIAATLEQIPHCVPDSLDWVLEEDVRARKMAEQSVMEMAAS